MQQFVQSLGSFTSAMSLFGLQQTMNMLRPPQPGATSHPATEAFEAVTRAAVDQLGDAGKRTYDGLDSVQRQMLDASFSLLTMGGGRRAGGGGGGGAARGDSWMEMARQAAAPLARMMPGGCCGERTSPQ